MLGVVEIKDPTAADSPSLTFPLTELTGVQVADSRRLYHFLKADYAIMALKSRQIKISDLENLNDDFEMMSLVVQKDDRLILEKNRRDLARSVGIVCMSTYWRSPLLWGHYADSFRGVCLGFDVPSDLYHPIKYVGRRPQLKDFGASSPSEIPLEHGATIISMKAAAWRYEKEYRSWIDLTRKEPDKNGLYFKDFGFDLVLKEAIFGPKSNLSKAEIAEAIGNKIRDVKIIKARTSHRNFSIVENRSPGSW